MTTISYQLKTIGTLSTPPAPPMAVESMGPGDWGPFSRELFQAARDAGEAPLVIGIGSELALSIMNQDGNVNWSIDTPALRQELMSYRDVDGSPISTVFDPSLGVWDVVIG